MTSSNTTHLPKALPPNVITWEARASIYEFGDGWGRAHKHPVHNTQCLVNNRFKFETNWKDCVTSTGQNGSQYLKSASRNILERIV